MKEKTGTIQYLQINIKVSLHKTRRNEMENGQMQRVYFKARS